MVLVQDVREFGQVIAGLAIAFLLLSALVAFLYFLASLLYTLRSNRKATANASSKSSSVPPGLWVAGLIFG